jgi:adenine-specific DNA-methyltransferase
MLQGKEWKKLPIDTKNFDEEFKWRLIKRVCDNYELDKVLDGWLIKK